MPADPAVHVVCPARGDAYDAASRFGQPTVSRSLREHARLFLLRTDYRNASHSAADWQLQLGSPAATPAAWEA